MITDGFLLDIKSPQVSRNLLNIMANLNNAVVSVVSTSPLTSKSSSPFTNPLEIIPSASITIGITVTFIFHSFSQFSSDVYVLISLFAFF